MYIYTYNINTYVYYLVKHIYNIWPVCIYIYIYIYVCIYVYIHTHLSVCLRGRNTDIQISNDNSKQQ